MKKMLLVFSVLFSVGASADVLGGIPSTLSTDLGRLGQLREASIKAVVRAARPEIGMVERVQVLGNSHFKAISKHCEALVVVGGDYRSLALQGVVLADSIACRN